MPDLSTLLPLKSIQERDIDLLLIEEWSSNPAFREWFLQRTVGHCSYDSFKVLHSLSDSALGESDVVFSFTEDGKTTLLLVENKIDAVFQPDQPNRYRQRGEKYKQDGECESFYTVLTAPRLYCSNLQLFDRNIEYEQITEWFKEHADLGERGKFKILVLKTAIEKMRRGYFAVRDEAVTDFWWEYYRYAQQRYPELHMKEPGLRIPKRSSFIRFEPGFFADDKRYSLIHKASFGNIDLQLNGKGDEVQLLQQQYSSRLAKEIKIVRAGKSACFRIKTTKVDPSKKFGDQVAFVEEGLRQLRVLFDWATANVLQNDDVGTNIIPVANDSQSLP